MSLRVHCVFPDGSSHVLLIPGHPTVSTFQLIARNYIKFCCKFLQLRFGVPPTYICVKLGSCVDVKSVISGITDHDTLWFDVCPSCREKCLSYSTAHSKSEERYRTACICSIVECVNQFHQPLSDENLSPHGYYYDLVCRELGLEDLSVYSFTCCPNSFVMYTSKLDRLIEVPFTLLNVASGDLIPNEHLLQDGFLFWVVSSHISLSHMNVYNVPFLPGRLFVYDSGLNSLYEISFSPEALHGRKLSKRLEDKTQEVADNEYCKLTSPLNAHTIPSQNGQCIAVPPCAYCGSNSDPR